MSWQAVAIAIAAILIVAGGIWGLVRWIGRLQKDSGAAKQHEESHVANDTARRRFDVATSRPLSASIDHLLARYRARRLRRPRLPKKPDADL